MIDDMWKRAFENDTAASPSLENMYRWGFYWNGQAFAKKLCFKNKYLTRQIAGWVVIYRVVLNKQFISKLQMRICSEFF